jgi:hypothetical protein
MTSSSVTIQITPEPLPSTPTFMGEVAAFAHRLAHTGIRSAIQEQVRFTHARFGHDDLIDVVAALIGSILSGEPTLLAFYERLAPFAEPFVAQVSAEISCLVARPCLVFAAFLAPCFLVTRLPFFSCCLQTPVAAFSLSRCTPCGYGGTKCLNRKLPILRVNSAVKKNHST